MNLAFRSALLLLGLFCAACASYGKRVPDRLLEKLPYESRIELLEAENDLALAIDRLDEAKAEILRTRDAIRRAKDRRSAAKDEVGKADDNIAREVAELAVAEADARVDFLRARQQVNVEEERIHELALRCAHARFELARVQITRKAKVEGSESLPVPDFEGQVKECEAAVAQRRAESRERAQQMAQAKDAWEKQKSALAKKTFDARASPYVE
ncbi:MAG: hypothetical protein HYZ28_07135 [Myxococcales bacterium]|nr:hypothetical protein [Myxococcales bacterium]